MPQSDGNIPGIVFEKLCLEFEGQTLFENLNYHLKPGQLTALLGPSGVGKSTLLKIITGLLQQDAVMHFSGKVYADDQQDLISRIAYLAQQDGLFPWLNVLDNVLLGARLRGESRKIYQTHALQLLGKVGLSEAVHKYPWQLSGGMRQRVALARTLLEDKPIVLLDEPFAAVDAITRWHLQELSLELLRGKTVLFITHDPLEALRIADTIIVLNGTPATISEEIILTQVAPREIGDDDLPILHTKLLEQLRQG